MIPYNASDMTRAMQIEFGLDKEPETRQERSDSKLRRFERVLMLMAATLMPHAR